jgi:hypothetical protein
MGLLHKFSISEKFNSFRNSVAMKIKVLIWVVTPYSDVPHHVTYIIKNIYLIGFHRKYSILLA